ncbi:6,7-dimethyl-8-ribityllumazine synthase [Hippea maritima]|uniref:6,7-dimethyl-8-ribityllumazine synthase n=1 Tax=Hippea maritima (strain ATCC 700847 / DSM 10411 / MH2) TaxID=760142 RepID=F2LY74_HIPMA|nr:6,7-dimethyl-8-ribityllumazine synthase [Hippea maritima]AEA34397.1 6,7-dimethyl-8-ribityllumazine synthase [Hippea maritima DSM 10411]
MKIIEGVLDAKGLKVAVIVSRFNSFITQKLLDGAKDAFLRHNGDESKFEVFMVPGAFEIPMLLSKLADKSYDGILCLGAVIRGSTPHFDFVANETAKGIAQVSLKSKMPVSFGILTTDTIEQAIERAGTKMGNKGFDAMVSLIEMMNLYKNV